MESMELVTTPHLNCLLPHVTQKFLRLGPDQKPGLKFFSFEKQFLLSLFNTEHAAVWIVYLGSVSSHWCKCSVLTIFLGLHLLIIIYFIIIIVVAIVRYFDLHTFEGAPLFKGLLLKIHGRFGLLQWTLLWFSCRLNKVHLCAPDHHCQLSFSCDHRHKCNHVMSCSIFRASDRDAEGECGKEDPDHRLLQQTRNSPLPWPHPQRGWHQVHRLSCQHAPEGSITGLLTCTI